MDELDLEADRDRVGDDRGAGIEDGAERDAEVLTPLMVSTPGIRHIFLLRARRALAEVDAASEEIAALKGLTAGRLVLGVMQALAGLDLPRLTAAFHAAHPGVDVSLREDSTRDMFTLAALETGHRAGRVRAPREFRDQQPQPPARARERRARSGLRASIGRDRPSTASGRGTSGGAGPRPDRRRGVARRPPPHADRQRLPGPPAPARQPRSLTRPNPPRRGLFLGGAGRR